MSGWQLFAHRKKHLSVFGAVLCIFLFFLAYYGRHDYSGIVFHYGSGHVDVVNPDPIPDSKSLQTRYVEFWRAFHGLMLDNDPQCKDISGLEVAGSPHDVGYKADHDEERPDLVRLNEADILRIKSAHSSFVQDIRSATSAELVYVPSTKGIVVTTSDNYLPTLAISLSMLRKTGSNLPVEVFLDKSTQYTEDFCSNILRYLNAECRYLFDIFVGSEFEPHSYQFKVLAIIFSSFEDILFLDFDAWPISNPDPLFELSPYSESGMVLWPDFWYSTESSSFFEIAGIDPIPKLNERASTESGIILYNKVKHAQSILLATYYNFYGPDCYYRLQSQHASGEGDKVTFGAAAQALNENFYDVRKGVKAVGRFTSAGEFVGSAMVQFDPIQDQIHKTDSGSSAPKPLFMHANYPKMDPYKIFDSKDGNGLHKPVQDRNGSWVRAWMPREEAVELFGVDLEQEFWEIIRMVTCERLQGVGLPKDTRDTQGLDVIQQRDQRVCSLIDEYRKDIFGVQIQSSGEQTSDSSR